MNHPDHQPMRDALTSWRQHIIDGGHDSPDEYPPIAEASASFRAASQDSAQADTQGASQDEQRLSNAPQNPRQMASPLPTPGSDELRANVRRRKAISRYTRKGYGRALVALESTYPQHVQAIRDYTAALHHEIAAARIEARHLRAQGGGDGE